MMKYAAAMLTLLALVGAGWAIVAVSRPMPGVVPVDDASSTLNQQIKAGDNEVLHLHGLEQTLDRIKLMPLAAQAREAMLPVYASPAQSSAQNKSKQPVSSDVSLIYVSPDLQKVVIDGVLLGPGDMLPGGARLVSVAPDQMVVERYGHRKVIRLPKPEPLGVKSNTSHAR